MNKLASVLVKDKISLPFLYRCISQREFFCPSIAFHQKLKQISLLQPPLPLQRNLAIFAGIKEKLSSLVSSNTKVKIASCLVYEKIADDIDHNKFIQYFELPDTLQSWFLSIQLHVWMTILITVPEKNGREFRNCLVVSMWNDVEMRLDRLTEMKSSLKKKYLTELVGQFQAALIAYDEGILSDDAVLAAAAWRTLFACQYIDPKLLEAIVLYIRKQLSHLDSQSTEKIMYHSFISFLPLDSIFSDKVN